MKRDFHPIKKFLEKHFPVFNRDSANPLCAEGSLTGPLRRWSTTYPGSLPKLERTGVSSVLAAVIWGMGCLVGGAGAAAALASGQVFYALATIPAVIAIVVAYELLNSRSPFVFAVQNHLPGREAYADDVHRIAVWNEHSSWIPGAFREVIHPTGPTYSYGNADGREALAGLKVLSFGLIEPDEDIFILRKASFETIEAEADWVSRTDECKNLCQELASIWKSAISPATLSLRIHPKEPVFIDADKAWEMGRKLGVDSMVEAYLAGVPAEDIISSY